MITDLHNQLDLIDQTQKHVHYYKKKKHGFNVQVPSIFTSSDLDNKPTLTSYTYSKNNTYTQSQVNQQIRKLIASAPAALNSLNKLATALNDDSSFAGTFTNSTATKQPQLKNLGGAGSTIFMIMTIV